MSESSNLTPAQREFARASVEELDDKPDRAQQVLAESERLFNELRSDPKLADVPDSTLREVVRDDHIDVIAAGLRRLAGLEVQTSRRSAGEPPLSGDAFEEAVDRLLRVRPEYARVERAQHLLGILRRRSSAPGEGRRFVAWMRRQVNRRGPIGDLAREIAGDREFPRRDFEAADEYLWRSMACSFAHVTLAEAWWAFIREEMEAGR